MLCKSDVVPSDQLKHKHKQKQPTKQNHTKQNKTNKQPPVQNSAKKKKMYAKKKNQRPKTKKKETELGQPLSLSFPNPNQKHKKSLIKLTHM